MRDNDSGSNAVAYFLVRSLLLGFPLYLCGVFFSPTRRVLRFLMGLGAVQMAADLVRFVIVLTLLGLVIQGAFYLLRSILHLLFSERKPQATR